MKEVKRLISTGFWNDDKVLNDFSPEDKYFLLYLLSNPYTTQLGVYHLPLKKASLELGYTLDAVKTLIDRFEKKYKIIRFNKETSEVAIKNYLRHSIVRGGKPVMDCLEKDLKGVKDLSLVAYVFNNALTEVKDINDTVLEFINKHLEIKEKYIYINDNDNERYVDESWYESSEKPKNQSKPKIVYFPNDEQLNKAFEDFVENRKKIKKPMTDRAIELAIKKLNDLSAGDGDLAIKIIEQSIMSGYLGLFPLKEEKQQDRKAKTHNFNERKYDFAELEKMATGDNK